jgi:UDP-N-acetylglucosamine--N-acetylmuramyl-(pentapeptide) pyrophosphoryl-undecaprenol N-acetylglucosamine transferase
VYPALAVLQSLDRKADPVLWVGGEGGIEASLVQRAGIPFSPIPAAGVHGVSPLRLPQNLWQLVRGYQSARRILKEFQPNVILLTGGYVAVPMALAGRHIPTLVYVPDIEPGQALKVAARFANCIALTAESSRTFFPGRSQLVVTGYPTRHDLKLWNRKTAQDTFKLDPDLRTLLVFGGSKGARSINRALIPALPGLLKEMQIIHITGQLDYAEVEAARQSLEAQTTGRYHVYSYLHEEMGAALSAADLVVSRAGASTLGEFPLFGLPAVLVPYPYAWHYQKVNAQYLVDQGAAILLEDHTLADRLSSTILNLFNAPEKLENMRKAMKALARPDSASKIAAALTGLAQTPVSGKGIRNG